MGIKKNATTNGTDKIAELLNTAIPVEVLEGIDLGALADVAAISKSLFYYIDKTGTVKKFVDLRANWKYTLRVLDIKSDSITLDDGTSYQRVIISVQAIAALDANNQRVDYVDHSVVYNIKVSVSGDIANKPFRKGFLHRFAGIFGEDAGEIFHGYDKDSLTVPAYVKALAKIAVGKFFNYGYEEAEFTPKGSDKSYPYRAHFCSPFAMKKQQ